MLFDRSTRSLADHGCKDVAVVLSASTQPPISQIYLHSNSISSLGAEFLAAALLSLSASGRAKGLSKLCLHENEIGDDGACAVLESIRRVGLPSLIRLDLSSNCIGDRGAEASCAWESRPLQRTARSP